MSLHNNNKMTTGCVLAVLGCLSLLTGAHGYFITVDAHAEECFFEKVTAGTKLGKRRAGRQGEVWGTSWLGLAAPLTTTCPAFTELGTLLFNW